VGEGLDEPVVVAEFIASCRTEHGIAHTIACRALEVSQSWFHKQINRTPTAREQRRARLEAEIGRLFTASGGTYGSPRITRDLREAGWKVSVDTVAVRMAELGLAGRPPEQRRFLTRQGRRPAAPDLVRRSFTAAAPDVSSTGKARPRTVGCRAARGRRSACVERVGLATSGWPATEMDRQVDV
jgi:hypothetical protein